MPLIRLVKVHYSVLQLALPGLLRKMVMQMKVLPVHQPMPLVTERNDPMPLVTVGNDEASLTSQPHLPMVRRVQPQIMLMEVPLRRLRYSVVSSQHQKMVRKVH